MSNELTTQAELQRQYSLAKAARQAGINNYPSIKSFQDFKVSSGTTDTFVSGGSFGQVLTDGSAGSMGILYIPKVDGAFMFTFRTVFEGPDGEMVGAVAVIQEVVSGNVLASNRWNVVVNSSQFISAAPVAMANVKAGVAIIGIPYADPGPGSPYLYSQSPTFFTSMATFTPAP